MSHRRQIFFYSVFLLFLFILNSQQSLWAEDRGGDGHDYGNWWEQNRSWNNNWDGRSQDTRQNNNFDHAETAQDEIDSNFRFEQKEMQRQAKKNQEEHEAKMAQEKAAQEEAASKNAALLKFMPKQAIKAISSGSERYQVVFDGSAVLDKETGLIWQRYLVQPYKGYWRGNAHLKCLNKTIGYRAGWRLPTAAEILSLADASQKTHGTGIMLAQGHPFLKVPDPQELVFWTSDKRLDAQGKERHLVVNMYQLHAYEVSLKEETMDQQRHSLWCVRDFK